MAIFQIITALSLFLSFLTQGGHLQNTKTLIFFSISAVYFFSPLIYLYTVRLSGTKTLNDNYHFILSFLILAYSIIRIVTDNGSGSHIRSIPLDMFILLQVGIFIFNSYILAMNRLIQNYMKKMEDRYSSIDDIKLKWLSFILRLGSASSILFFISNIAGFFFPDHLYLTSRIIDLVSFFLVLLFLLSISYFSFLQPETKQEPQYTKQRLTESLEVIYMNKLLKSMEEEKLYLDPELNMKQLSESVSISPPQITMILNLRLNQNFYHFINNYRIKAACIMLKTDNDKGILEIAMESGFNSKTTFNNFFKKVKHMTPREYRVQNKIDNLS